MVKMFSLVPGEPISLRLVEVCSRDSVDVLAYVFTCAASKGLEILWEPWCIHGRVDVVELQNSSFA
jgi:hypothetical protein